jgi:Superfamily II DNA and RNA helicases
MEEFIELGISQDIGKAIRDMGWSAPTDIQAVAIPIGLEGKDILAQAQTGTGKTGAYATIVLDRTEPNARIPSILILAPTRELAKQVDDEVYKLTKYSRHRSMAIYGGASISDQIYKLKRGVDVVVGTPGRVKDLITRECLDLSGITEVVLDEADRMLDMGFADELNFIMDRVPTERHTLLFSATMAKEIKQLAMRYMNSPHELLISKDDLCSDLTDQYYVSVSRNEKRTCLEKILRNGSPKTIVFCQTKRMCDELAESLSREFKVGVIHGDLQQNKRERVIKSYKANSISILVATDVAARGLDINNIDCVVNYDVPGDTETYLHRIGRTGRAGKTGSAVTFVTKQEERHIRMYEKATKKEIKKMKPGYFKALGNGPVTDGTEIREETQVMQTPAFEPRAERRERPVFERTESPRRERPMFDNRESAPKERPAKMFADAVEEEPVFKKKTPVLVKKAIPEAKKGGMVVINVNLGKEDGFGRTQITEFIMESASLSDGSIGRIGLGSAASFVEIPFDKVNSVIDSLMTSRHNDKKIFAQIAPQKVPYKKAQSGALRA